MFDRPTVIILGAGASAQFGFPLGAQLVGQIEQSIGPLVDRWSKRGWELSPLGVQNADKFQKQPCLALASYLKGALAQDSIPQDFDLKAFRTFYEDLKRQNFETIDRFIRDNPSHTFLGKLLIAQFVIARMYAPNERLPEWELERKSFSEPQPNSRNNWYRQLVHLLREGARSAEDLCQNELHILTFNYDLSLEIAMSRMLGDTQRHQGANYKDCIRIIHINGAPDIERIPERIEDVGRFLLNVADSFHVIDDEELGSIVEMDRRIARDLIRTADRVFIMGFNFDRSNLRALGMESLSERQRQRTFCLNFEGNLGVRRRIEELGVAPRNVYEGSRTEPMFIDQAISDGFLEL